MNYELGLLTSEQKESNVKIIQYLAWIDRHGNESYKQLVKLNENIEELIAAVRTK